MRSAVRNRKSSFFDVKDFQCRGRTVVPTLAGSFLVTHSDMPDTRRYQSTADTETRHKLTSCVPQNTYQVEPETLFCPTIVEKILKDKLEFLELADYDPERARTISSDLANAIRVHVKDLFPRYKLVVNVMIGGKGDQGITVASKCFWDGQRDNFASFNVTSRNLFAVATVHGIYFE